MNLLIPKGTSIGAVRSIVGLTLASQPSELTCLYPTRFLVTRPTCARSIAVTLYYYLPSNPYNRHHNARGHSSAAEKGIGRLYQSPP